jgi:hypothetical protein
VPQLLVLAVRRDRRTQEPADLGAPGAYHELPDATLFKPLILPLRICHRLRLDLFRAFVELDEEAPRRQQGRRCQTDGRSLRQPRRVVVAELKDHHQSLDRKRDDNDDRLRGYITNAVRTCWAVESNRATAHQCNIGI